MTEEDARSWFAQRCDPAVIQALSRYCDLLTTETVRQNLIAPSTVAMIWSRHLLDSAQLIAHAPPDWRHWVDIGSGAGLPGLVVALLSGRAVTLVEPRRLRATFLTECCNLLGLTHVKVMQCKAAAVTLPTSADVISARAVASLDRVFDDSRHFANLRTIYILPKGASAKTEVAAARRSWQGVFHVEQSIVDPHSGIVIATGISPR